MSSPYVRCVQTVEPLAEAAGLEVEVDDRLAEGADTDAALRAAARARRRATAWPAATATSSRALLRRLVAMGMAVDGPLLDQKGSVWTIHLKNGVPTKGRYTPPGA